MDLFIYEMNRNAKGLGLNQTNFANPHGLSHWNNKSTAADVGKLACIAMKDPYIRDIVNKSKYECQGKDFFNETVEYTWISTNKLLGKGFNGLKTGVTKAAGPCLAASYEKDNLHLVIILMHTETRDNRWHEVPKLTLWAMNRLNKLCEHFRNNKLQNKPLAISSYPEYNEVYNKHKENTNKK